MKLTTIAQQKLSSEEVKMKIALDLGKSYMTIRRWVNANPIHENLTKKSSINAIMKHTGLEENQIFQ